MEPARFEIDGDKMKDFVNTAVFADTARQEVLEQIRDLLEANAMDISRAAANNEGDAKLAFSVKVTRAPETQAGWIVETRFRLPLGTVKDQRPSE